MQKVLFIDKVHPLIREELVRNKFTCDEFPGYNRHDFIKIAGRYHGIIIRSKFILDKEFLDHCLSLSFIGRVGAGMENIDVDYAQSKGIACFNSPEGNRDAVGEHTVGMLLSLINHLNRADRQVRNRIWDREGNRGIEIKGRIIGIIGYGNMGSAFAQRLKGFEANVISYDKYKKEYTDGNTRETTMAELYETADIISLHVPLTEETRYLVHSGFIHSFRKPIILINTSRGPIVNTSDLVAALRSGKIAGAALDVLEYEDQSFEQLAGDLPEAYQYLCQSDQVILTPHIAGWTQESEVKLADVLIKKILTFYHLK
jgi:D-3-phosphoglycerate dehydrogenase